MIGKRLGSSATPRRATSTEVRMVYVMMTRMPTGIIVVEVGIIPRIIPHMAIVIAGVIPPVVTIRIAIRITPMITPSERIAHAIVPVVMVACCREHIGIHTIVIHIPVPTGPQGTAIHDIPVERTTHRDSVAGTAKTDDAHGILII